MGNTRSIINIILINVTIALLFSGQAYGQAGDAGIVQSIQDQFEQETANWFGPLQDIAIWLLISLATISWTWSAGQMILRNADLQEFVAELVRLIMFTGFFLALILNAAQWSSALIDGFKWAGNEAAGAGISRDLSPSAILERGFIIAEEIIQASSRIALPVFGILALVSLVIYALMAAYVLLVLAEMYIVTAAGVLLLGFGGSQWTVDYAKRYITYCVSVGAKLYILFLIVGIGEQFVYNWAQTQDKGQISLVLSIIGVLVMLLVLIKMIPDILQGIINGTSMGSSTPSVGGMAAAGAGAVMAAGRTTGNTVTGTTGGVMAVREASKLSGMQLGGSTNTSNGPDPGGSTAASAKGPMPMPQGQGPAGPSRVQHAGQTMKNLAKAAGSTVAGRAMGEYSAIHAPFGGAMAQKLRAERLSGGQSHAQKAETDTVGAGGMSGSIGPGKDQPYHSPSNPRS